MEVVAPSVEVGLAAGAKALGVSADRADYEVLEDPRGEWEKSSEKVRIRVRVKPPEPRVDGKFLIACRDGLFHLVITPTSGGGRPVEQGQMEGALRGLPLPDGAEAVWQAELARPSGKPVALLGGQVGATRAVSAEELAGDGTIAQAESGEEMPEPEYLGPPFTVLVTEDHMQVWLLNADLKFDITVDRDAITTALEGLGVTYGVIE